MWDSSSFGRFLEMRSAFTEVRAIREDLNARRRKGEHPENRSMSRHCAAGTMRLLL
jgi:hypothetical protein